MPYFKGEDKGHMAIKLIIFDVDNTLAKPNKPVPDRIVKSLRKIESKGVRIVLISGKPTSYLSGLARQIGLCAPILSGENGAITYYSAKFPPESMFSLIAHGEDHGREQERFKERILKDFGEQIWIQPNLINLTIFPMQKGVMDKLLEEVRKYSDEKQTFSRKFKIYRHADSLEIVPKGVDKGIALEKIMSLEGLKPEEVIAIGDGQNDIPMFKKAGISIGINIAARTTRTFATIDEAIDFVRELSGK